MKELSATASAPVDAAPERCTEVLAVVERYPSWDPKLILSAETLVREGRNPVRARATVRVTLGPIAHDLELVLAVAVEAGRRVTLTRLADHASDAERFELAWRIQAGPRTMLHVDLSAYLDVPRLMPVGKLGGSLAQGLVVAASRALDGSSPNASARSS